MAGTAEPAYIASPAGATPRFAPTVTQLVLLAALAGCCAAVLYSRAYVEFERIRISVQVPQRLAATDAVTVVLPDLPGLVGEPTSIVLQLENRTPENQTVLVSVNRREADRVTVAPHHKGRVDLRVPDGFERATGNLLTVESVRGAWSLDRIEVGNAYGFSRGLFSFVVAPAGTSRYRSVPFWAAGLAGIALFLISMWNVGRFRSPYARFIHRSVASMVVVVLAATLIVPPSSRYTLLLSMQAFWLCVALVYAPYVKWAFEHIRSPAITCALAVRRLLLARRIALLRLATVVLFLGSISRFYDMRTGFTPLIGFGDQFSATALPVLRDLPHAVSGPSGYDGQFYAQLALDPLTRDPGITRALDNFAYRGRRILFAWTAYALGLGQPAWILQAYALQNVLCWLIMAALLLRWLPAADMRSFFAWFACLFNHGLIVSSTDALLEGPSLLLLVVAVMAIEEKRPWLAACIMGVSGMGRETNVLSGTALVDGVSPRTIRTLAAQALVIAVPLVLWLIYLRLSHPQVPGELIGSNRNFAAPLSGYAEDWRVTVASLRQDGWASFSRFDLFALISVTVQTIFFLVRQNWSSPWYRVGFTYVILMVCLGTAVWEGSPGAFTRVLLPMTCAYNILLPRERAAAYWSLAVLGNLTILNSLEVLRTPYIWPYL